MERRSRGYNRVRIAAIDIGTNTVLLLIADIDAHGEITTVVDEISIPRLGEGALCTGLISESAIERTISVLLRYKDFLNQTNTKSVIVCGTSALREAKNQVDVINQIKMKTGFKTEVLNGTDEALLSFRGAISNLTQYKNNAVVLDIGGGSTEIACLTGKELITASMPIGAVGITERFFKRLPPETNQLDEASRHIINEIGNHRSEDLTGKTWIGVAGTPSTLACLDQNLTDFDRKSISLYRLKINRVEYWLEKFASLIPLQIKSLSRAVNGREDIITAGTLILFEIMRKYKFSELIVSERGLRYGLVLKEWEKYS